MHYHNVFFWLQGELSSSALLEFEKGLESLTKVPMVTAGYYGKPADTNRTVVDNTYSYGLTLKFNDTADHNCYQAHPIHLAFVDQNAAKWSKVQVFDIETKNPN